MDGTDLASLLYIRQYISTTLKILAEPKSTEPQEKEGKIYSMCPSKKKHMTIYCEQC